MGNLPEIKSIHFILSLSQVCNIVIVTMVQTLPYKNQAHDELIGVDCLKDSEL